MKLLDAWLSITRDEPGWYWMCDDAHFGDLYQVLALVGPFRDHHGWSRPLRLVTTSERQAEVATLFKDRIDEIIVAPALQGDAQDWSDLHESLGLPCFALNSPLVVWPILSPEVGRELWVFAIDQLGLPVTNLQRRMLHLPADAEPRHPSLLPERERLAHGLCEAAGVDQGRSMVLFPRARSAVVEASAHFAALAARLKDEGLKVFTSVSDGEDPIEGTSGVVIPFPLLPDVAEYAGWIVAVRSGVADIASSAACRKTVLYPDRGTLATWSLKALALSEDATERVACFDFDSPATFASAVCNRSPIRSGSGEEERRGAGRWTFPTIPKNAQAAAPFCVSGVPPLDHERAWRRAPGFLDALAAAAERSDACVFASRSSAANSYLEPVGAWDLAHRLYHHASFRHDLLVGSPSDFAPRSVLPDNLIRIGDVVEVAAALGGPGHRDYVAGALPLCHAGLQFLDGWSRLEAWGIWTVSCLSTLGLAIEETDLGGGVEIILEVTPACFSEAMPQLRFSVSANRVHVGDYVLEAQADPQMLRICLPSPTVARIGRTLLEFRFAEVKSPSDQVAGAGDPRALGLGLRSVRVEPLSAA